MSGKVDKNVWVKNDHHTSVRVAADELNDENKVVRTVTVTFLTRKTDRITGELLNRGYTMLPETDFDVLYKGSVIFKEFIDKQMFIRYDDPPAEALSDAQRIMSLTAKIGEHENTIRTMEARHKDLFESFQEYRKAHPEKGEKYSGARDSRRGIFGGKISLEDEKPEDNKPETENGPEFEGADESTSD